MWEISRHLETKIFRGLFMLLCMGANFAKFSNTNFLCCKHPFPSPIDDEVSNHQQMDFIFLIFNCNSCVGITKVKIYVTWFMPPHLCLLGCSYCLSICWSGYHLILRDKGVAKVCAIHLWHGGEHMFSNWPLGDLCLLFNVKL
jgi:hypothetical protein